VLVIRSLIFFIGYATLTILYGSSTLLIWALPKTTRHKFITSWTRVIIAWLRIVCNIQYQVVGREYLDPSTPMVVLSKHQSAWETILLQGLYWPATTVLKKELLRIPFFGWGISAIRPIAIDRSNPRAALKQVKLQGTERLNDGLNIIIFPEGTRVASGESSTYARSGADIAVSAGVNIQAVAINAGECWPRGFLKYPGTITVKISPPISCEGSSSKTLTQTAKTWIDAEMTKMGSPLKK